MSAPTNILLQALKQIFHYLRGALHHGFCYTRVPLVLFAFTYANWAMIHLIGSQTLGLLSFLAEIPLSGLQRSKPQRPNPSLMQSIQIKFGFNSDQLADIFTKALPSSFP